jgi:hypothetical protein
VNRRHAFKHASCRMSGTPRVISGAGGAAIRRFIKENDSQRKAKPESEPKSYAQPQARFGVSVSAAPRLGVVLVPQGSTSSWSAAREHASVDLSEDQVAFLVDFVGIIK